jgi:preprotein translocase subunit SecG
MEFVLLAIMLISVAYCMVSLLFIKEGSKGITKPYKGKSGKLHTAKKSRADYIV